MAAGFTRIILFTGVSINQPIRLKMHISRYELDGCLDYAQRFNVISLLALCFNNKRCRMLVVGGPTIKNPLLLYAVFSNNKNNKNHAQNPASVLLHPFSASMFKDQSFAWQLL